jgi:hypothetical protein
MEYYSEHSQTKKRDLLESIEIAKKQLGKADVANLEKRLAKTATGEGSGTKKGGTQQHQSSGNGMMIQGGSEANG